MWLQIRDRRRGCGGIWHQVLGSPEYLILKIPSRVVNDFMDIDATETYLIPTCSRRQAQQPCGLRSGIGQVGMEESGIESWDRPST